MNKVTRSSIETLARPQSEYVISIYLPTHRYPTPPHIQEDRTRYKKLLRQAKDAWQEKATNDMASPHFEQLESKMDSLEFWQQTTEGMAIFISAEKSEVYHLPIECEERVCVETSFDITPLLIVSAYDQPYYLLALAMHNTKLFKGDIYGLEPIAIEFPSSPEEALNIDEMFSGSNTVRSQNGPSGASNVIAPHGQGDSNGAGREERLQYFRIIDNMIAESKNVDSSLPVLIAGTDSEAGDYRHMSKLSALIHAYIPGNYTNSTFQDLSALAWPVIQAEIISKRAIEAVDQLNEKIGIQKSSYDYEELTEAANMGRIKTLLVGITRKTTDTVSDAIQTAVPVLTFTKQYEYDNVTELVKKVLAQGGNILGVGNELLPAKIPVAAIYRY
ncbi:MAG TPA: hypothetical protein VGO98_02245 [Candidatus Saccharimonadales bacterium]|jgi:hypothetical protein|nr:hypothetical protein [Candidatus Saccharimonadales bacterium]